MRLTIKWYGHLLVLEHFFAVELVQKLDLQSEGSYWPRKGMAKKTMRSNKRIQKSLVSLNSWSLNRRPTVNLSLQNGVIVETAFLLGRYFSGRVYVQFLADIHPFWSIPQFFCCFLKYWEVSWFQLFEAHSWWWFHRSGHCEELGTQNGRRLQDVTCLTFINGVSWFP